MAIDSTKLSKIYELYYADRTYTEIAAEIGCSIRTVSYHVTKGIADGVIKRRDITSGHKVVCFDETILDLHQKKWTHKKIAEKIGMSPAFVTARIRYFKDIGKISEDRRHDRPFEMTDPIVDKIANLHNDGMSCAKIAKQLGVTTSSVVHVVRVGKATGKITRESPVYNSDRYAVHKARRDTAVALYSLGYATKDIAELLDVNVKTVNKYVVEWKDITNAKEKSS